MPLISAVFLTACLTVVSNAATKEISLGDVSLAEVFGRPKAHHAAPAIVPSRAPRAPDTELGDAFWTLRAKAVAAKFPLTRWFRDTHVVYIIGLLPPADHPKLLEIFRYLSARLDAGERDVFAMLNHAPHPEVVARVQTIDGRVRHLKHQHKTIIRLAIAKHEVEMNQKYGDKRYSYHLRAVRGVLKRFGVGPKDSYAGLFLGTAAWLHDIQEDTNITFGYLRDLFGIELATVVWAVTKRTKLATDTTEWNTLLTLAKTGLYPYSRLLKLADRIANVEEGMIRLFRGQGTKVHKYVEDWPRFHAALYIEGEADEMWHHLERLLTDQSYAHEFAVAELMRCDSVLTAG